MTVTPPPMTPVGANDGRYSQLSAWLADSSIMDTCSDGDDGWRLMDDRTTWAAGRPVMRATKAVRVLTNATNDGAVESCE